MGALSALDCSLQTTKKVLEGGDWSWFYQGWIGLSALWILKSTGARITGADGEAAGEGDWQLMPPGKNR